MSYFSTTDFSSSNLGAFGDLQVMQMTPVMKFSFATGIRDQLMSNTTITTGSVSTSNSRLWLQTGTSTTGSAIIQSNKTIAYRAGQGITYRMTPMFSTPVANSKQYFGVGNSSDGYFIGYSNTTFGIFHRNNNVDTFIPQASWNGDPLDGTGNSGLNWNKSYGIPIMIKYPYLGYGNIFFYIQNPDSGKWILFHIIKYANTSTQTQLSNPFLSVYGQVLNLGNSSNISLYVGSIGVFIDGSRTFHGPQYGIDANKAAVTTEVEILSLKNCSSINGVPNRGMARLRAVSISGSSSNSNVYAILRLKKNVVLTGSSFTPISGSTVDNGTTLTNAQSILSSDISSTISGGYIIWNISINGASNAVIDLTPFDIYLGANEILTFTIQSSASATYAISVNWQEDVQ